jgi:ABC-2 type transport system permease protein
MSAATLSPTSPTPETVADRAQPGRVRRAVSDAWTLSLRVLLYYKNSPGLVGVSLAAPIAMLVVFGYVFGSAIQAPGGRDYRGYLIPGLFVLIAVNGVMPSMIGAARDLDRGMTDRLRTLPISRGAALLGQAVADLLVSVVVLAAMVGVGLAVGWRAHDGLGRSAAALALLLLLRFAMVWVGFFAGVLCGREEIAGQAGLLVFPIGMVSNVFVPIGGMPGWLRAIAQWNPVSTVAAACRSLFGDTVGPAPASPWPLAHPVEATLGWCVLLLVVFAPLAVRRFSSHGR